MKRIFLVTALVATALLSSGCVSTLLSVAHIPGSGFDAGCSDGGGGIDPITQAGIDASARQTQEDAQRMSDWVTQQNNQNMMDMINQMNAQASQDAANAAAAAGAAAAASVPSVNP